MSFTKFYKFGFTIQIGTLVIVQGMDAHGKYVKFTSSFYKTVIYDQEYKRGKYAKI